jgi:hypothetical protein
MASQIDDMITAVIGEPFQQDTVIKGAVLAAELI